MLNFGDVLAPFFYALNENSEYSILNISMWMAFVSILYIIISSIIGNFKSQIRSGIVVKYGSYFRYFTSFICKLFVYIMIIVSVDCLLFSGDILVIYKIISVLVIVFNFIMKAEIIFIVSSDLTQNMVVAISLILEIVSLLMKRFVWVNPLTWSMISRYDLENGSYMLILVLVIEIFVFMMGYIFMVKTSKVIQ